MIVEYLVALEHTQDWQREAKSTVPSEKPQMARGRVRHGSMLSDGRRWFPYLATTLNRAVHHIFGRQTRALHPR